MRWDEMGDVQNILHRYFQEKNFHAESDFENFDSLQRHDDIICHECLIEAKSEIKDQIEGR